mmetsp:Transcript_21020/g.58291  ORF Transcript_21020/g.58291 Transcript_21020/m.58291 type:complete len:207 (-) Transcript_21020:1625-2245(-)
MLLTSESPPAPGVPQPSLGGSWPEGQVHVVVAAAHEGPPPVSWSLTGASSMRRVHPRRREAAATIMGPTSASGAAMSCGWKRDTAFHSTSSDLITTSRGTRPLARCTWATATRARIHRPGCRPNNRATCGRPGRRSRRQRLCRAARTTAGRLLGAPSRSRRVSRVDRACSTTTSGLMVEEGGRAAAVAAPPGNGDTATMATHSSMK